MSYFLRLLLIGILWLACPAIVLGQAPSPSAERPFSTMAEIWSRALDRIAQEIGRPRLLEVEVDHLRTEISVIRQAAALAANQARDEANSLRTLLAPLEARSDQGSASTETKTTDSKPPDRPSEPDAVRQQRDRLRADLALVDARVKQAELIIARADLLATQVARIRSDRFTRTILRKRPSPLAPSTWLRLDRDISFAWRTQMASWDALASSGALTAAWHDGERRGGTIINVIGLLAGWLVFVWLRRRYWRSEKIAEPSYRDRALAATLDGIGMVALPVLAILLVLSWLPTVESSLEVQRPALNTLLSIGHNAIFFLIVYGLSESSLTPRRPTWRLLPFSADSAAAFCGRIQRLAGFMTIAGPIAAFWLLRLPGGTSDVAGLASIFGLAIAGGLLFFGLPALRSDAWQSSDPPDGETRPLIGGYSWLLGRLALGLLLIAIVVAAALGFTALAVHAGDALLDSLLVVFLAIVLHALTHDVVEAAGAPDTPPGRWLRRLFGLAPEAAIHGRFIIVLVADLALLVAVAIVLPILWGADQADVLEKAGRLLSGFSIGQHRISPVDIIVALLVFAAALAVVRFARGALRDRFLPSLRMQEDIKLSVDAVVNYVGIIVAILLAISALGIDFTNLALIVGALSVGIGLGLQNLANNTISGVVLLLERPIKVGDRVIVGRHEGIVRRINVRATEIETGQRALVIVPNSEFLQSAVVNWTYADNVGRIDVPITVVHGSDPDKVEAILRQAADDNPHIGAVPRPVFLFKAVTPTGLDFELRAHVTNIANTIAAQNALIRAILAGLAEVGIDVAAAPPPPRAPATTPPAPGPA
jgi:small-conductance mechanosensitive channel